MNWLTYLNQTLANPYDLTKIQNPSDALVYDMLKKSNNPFFRNLIRSNNFLEQYAPVYFDQDCFIKLTYKPNTLQPKQLPSSANFMLYLVLYDILVMDLDGQSREDIGERIRNGPYQNDLFYLHQTRNGYHVYLMSRKIKYCSVEAIEMRAYFSSDPNHSAIALYTGNSIRLNKKLHDTVHASKWVAGEGRGVIDSSVNFIYQKACSFLEAFGYYQMPEIFETPSLLSQLYRLWNLTVKTRGSFAVEIVERLSPLSLTQSYLNHTFTDTSKEKAVWNKYLSSRTIRPCQLSETMYYIWGGLQKRHFYQILEGSSDYAVVLQLQEHMYLIIFRELLVIDYDHPSQLKILFEFCRLHPGYFFRLVKTNKGYHAFLTSHRIPHNSSQAYEFGNRLGCDRLHINSSLIKGYAVRLNKKTETDPVNVYVEKKSVGSGREIPRLRYLYQYHLKLAEKYGQESVHMSNTINSRICLKNIQQKGESLRGGGGALPLSPPSA